MSVEQKKINLRSYNKVWKIENRIYAIQNIVLPVPVSPREVLYFFIVAFIMLLLSFLIPPLKIIPSILRFIAVPFGISQFLLKKKLDGKMPHKYMVSWVNYMLTKEQYIERFSSYNRNTANTKIVWLCSKKE
ncbi:TcpE family conjugal transfer membrane protein [Filifactor alocis]|uniref:TcpE family conjugal transfer membrane protein n=1 Tax=Filifactor alocis TaxID=143361 RepID=UPI0028D15332|nr:TcpE family conjugal transfer membrane protein [Filifactor alocis]